MAHSSILILSLTVFSFLLSAGLASAGILQRDDFQDTKSWWVWVQRGGGVCPSVRSGLITIKINDALDSHPSDSAIWNGQNIYGDCTITLRAKTLTLMQAGSLGFGLWNFNGNWATFELAQSEIAWFMKQFDPLDSARSWWGAWTRNRHTGQTRFVDLSEFDTSEWHLYKMERYQNHVSFSIDGTLVGHYQDCLPDGPLGFHLWIDNYSYPFESEHSSKYRAFNDPNILIVDFVEIRNGCLGESKPASGAILLRDMPNEMGRGAERFLWKRYQIQSLGGKTLILVTARVEGYDAHNDDDDICIVVDSDDLDWDSPHSFNGSEQRGQNKTLVYIVDFEEGEHTIDIYGDITPILYDVTVIGADNGEALLNETLNEQAPGGDNYLWKEILFECLGEQDVTVFISASAHENSDDDDDIRITLDEEDFGWNTSDSFDGNRLFGEASALTINRHLSAGSHILRIYADQTPLLHNVIVYGVPQRGIISGYPVPMDATSNHALCDGEPGDRCLRSSLNEQVFPTDYLGMFSRSFFERMAIRYAL